MPAMRVAVVDIGTNSTRLLVADVDRGSGAISELVRRSQVTRLGERVDAGGTLGEAAIGRVRATLSEYRQLIDEHRCTANMAVLTSAVRDASNGTEFTKLVRDEYGLDARALSGDEEAQLTFLGAMSERDERETDQTVVIDIGGGSTEFIVGHGHTAAFHTSLQAGVVRMSERHIDTDPPAREELQALAAETSAIFHEGVPARERASVVRAIAVAGTATSAAAIAQDLDPYDPAKVQGYQLTAATVDVLLARLAKMDEARRRHVAGLSR
jgi:exopolyphosphatase / guanosine-5'-triphosphate,3'-diphosphate pyrophosphatase